MQDHAREGRVLFFAIRMGLPQKKDNLLRAAALDL